MGRAGARSHAIAPELPVSESPTEPAGAESAVEGDLSWVHISGVLQLVEGDKLSGRIVVPDGEITVLDGMFCGARASGETGLDAMVKIIGLEEGSFRIVTQRMVPQPVQSITSVLLRCGQVLDDWWRLSEDTLLWAGPAVACHPVLRLLDGSRTVSQAVFEAGGSFVAAVESISDAEMDGELRLVDDAGSAETSVLDLELPDDVEFCATAPVVDEQAQRQSHDADPLTRS